MKIRSWNVGMKWTHLEQDPLHDVFLATGHPADICKEREKSRGAG